MGILRTFQGLSKDPERISSRFLETAQGFLRLPEDSSRLPKDSLELPKDSLDYPRIPRDCPRIPRNCPRIPRDCSRIPRDCSRIPRDCSRTVLADHVRNWQGLRRGIRQRSARNPEDCLSIIINVELVSKKRLFARRIEPAPLHRKVTPHQH